ncbi:MAG TPA: exonuclease domain-containing protein [Xanthobacteraceae bacterium]|nr:exonuclease domain-containing protein [Xanthobacteraceae bacterium]
MSDTIDETVSLIRVVDLETTGFPPDAEVIEVATVDVLRNSGRSTVEYHAHRNRLCRPSRVIPPVASAVHHIVDEDLIGAPSFADAWPIFTSLALDRYTIPVAAWCAHSAKFERAFISDEMTGGAPWVCTWKCALRLWPDAPAHSNQALRYWLKPPGLIREYAELAHRALPDAYVTAHLLAAMLETVPLEQLIQWTSEPALLPRVPFGQHRGKRWSEVDDGFLHWVLARDFDEDVMFAVSTEIKRRNDEARAAAEAPAA